MFLTVEADDDESAGAAMLLNALDDLAPKSALFRSADVIAYLKENETEHAHAIRGFIDARLQGAPHPKTVTARLKTIIDGPIGVNGEIWFLRTRLRPDTGADFWIEKKRSPKNAETVL